MLQTILLYIEAWNGDVCMCGVDGVGVSGRDEGDAPGAVLMWRMMNGVLGGADCTHACFQLAPSMVSSRNHLPYVTGACVRAHKSHDIHETVHPPSWKFSEAKVFVWESASSASHVMPFSLTHAAHAHCVTSAA